MISPAPTDLQHGRSVRTGTTYKKGAPSYTPKIRWHQKPPLHSVLQTVGILARLRNLKTVVSSEFEKTIGFSGHDTGDDL